MKRKCIKVLATEQKKRHQGSSNRIRKGIEVLAIEKEIFVSFFQDMPNFFGLPKENASRSLQ